MAEWVRVQERNLSRLACFLGPRTCEMEPCDRMRYGTMENKLHDLQWWRTHRFNVAIRILTLGLVRNLIKI